MEQASTVAVDVLPGAATAAAPPPGSRQIVTRNSSR